MVNVNDYRSDYDEKDMLGFIWARQHELVLKYLDIEEKSGLLQTSDVPVELDSPEGQARVKDFAWRAVEEVAEAFEVLEDCTFDGKAVKHFKEEIADGLHFIVEMCILAGLNLAVSTTPDADGLKLLYQEVFDQRLAHTYDSGLIDHLSVEDLHDDIKVVFAEFVTQLGIACNFLKLKPWKQTHVLTDKPRFYTQLRKSFLYFIRICIHAGMTEDDLVEMYSRKSQVNKFRQESMY